MLASSLFIRLSSSSRALAFRRSDMNVVRPRMVDMLLSVEKKIVAPLPPPGLWIVGVRFTMVGDVFFPEEGKVDDDGEGRLMSRKGRRFGNCPRHGEPGWHLIGHRYIPFSYL